MHYILVQTSSETPEATSGTVLILDTPPDKRKENEEEQNHGTQRYPPVSMRTTVPTKETVTGMDDNLTDMCRILLLAFRRMPVRDEEGGEEILLRFG